MNTTLRNLGLLNLNVAQILLPIGAKRFPVGTTKDHRRRIVLAIQILVSVSHAAESVRCFYVHELAAAHNLQAFFTGVTFGATWEEFLNPLLMLGFGLPRLYDHGIMSIIMNLFLDRDHRRGHFFDQLIVTLMSLKLSNTVSWPYETCSRSLTLGLSVQPGLHVLLFRRLFLKFKLFYNRRIIFIVTVKSSWPAKIYLRIKVYAENLLW